MNALEAINILIALTRLIGHASENLERVSAAIERAQREGRDLNDDEIAEIRAKRDSAVQAWREAGPAGE